MPEPRIIRSVNEGTGRLFQITSLMPSPDMLLRILTAAHNNLVNTLETGTEQTSLDEDKRKLKEAKEKLDAAYKEWAKLFIDKQIPDMSSVMIKAGEAECLLLGVGIKRNLIIFDTAYYNQLGKQATTTTTISQPDK